MQEYTKKFFSKGFIEYCKGYMADEKKDYETAFKYYSSAADLGHPTAQYALGILYNNGEGVVKDHKKALEWFLKSAKKGNSRAQYAMGLEYEKLRNYGKAFEWYQKSADQKEDMAQYKMGLFYEKGYGVAADIEKATYWYELAAKQEYAQAQKRLEELKKKKVDRKILGISTELLMYRTLAPLPEDK